MSFCPSHFQLHIRGSFSFTSHVSNSRYVQNAMHSVAWWVRGSFAQFKLILINFLAKLTYRNFQFLAGIISMQCKKCSFSSFNKFVPLFICVFKGMNIFFPLPSDTILGNKREDVVDGGYILHNVHWDRNERFTTIFKKICLTRKV